MEHYIKINNILFDKQNNKLNFRVLFNVSSGESGLLATQNYVFGDLSKFFFEYIAIDTDKTFVCSSEPSQQALYLRNITELDSALYEADLENKLIGTPSSTRTYEIMLLLPQFTGDYTYLIYYSDEYGNILRNGFDLSTHNRFLVWDISIDLNDISNGCLAASNLESNMFFVYIKLSGKYMLNSSNALRSVYPMAMYSLYDSDSLYENIYDSILSSRHERCCPEIDIDIANKIIFLHGFVAAHKTNKWRDIVKFWKLLHKDKSFKNHCNCNGR